MRSPLTGRCGFIVASLVVIAIATLTPRPDQAALVARTPPWCLVCGDLGAVDVLLNVALFVPLGAALGAAGFRLWTTALLCLALSASVELLQAAIPGRDPTVSDLLTNTLGGALGGLAAGWFHRLIRPDPATGRRLAGLWAALWLTQTGLTAAMVKPSLPRSWYWGQLAPDLEQFEQFYGRVASASVGPYRIRIRRLATSAQVRDALLAGQPLVGMTTPGTPTPGLAPIVSIFDRQQREIVLLGRWGDDLVYRLRTRAFDFRLRPPAIRVAGAFLDADTSLMGVAGRFDPGAGVLQASVSRRGIVTERRIALNPQWGWSLLLPFPYAHGVESTWLTPLWVFAWMLPLGYWGRAYLLPGFGGALALLGSGLVIVPLWFGLAPGSIWEWIAAAGGLAIGVVVARRVAGAVGLDYPPSARSAASP